MVRPSKRKMVSAFFQKFYGREGGFYYFFFLFDSGVLLLKYYKRLSQQPALGALTFLQSFVAGKSKLLQSTSRIFSALHCG